MKTVVGNNQIVLIEMLGGSFSEEIELGENTALVTGGDAYEFNNQEELQTFIASRDVGKFPAIPEIGEPCEINKIYSYGTNKVKCLQSHTRMAFTPEETPALWLIIETVIQGYPKWVQPTGAHDAYQINDIVEYKGGNWESKINANVTVPDGDIPFNRYWMPI